MDLSTDAATPSTGSMARPATEGVTSMGGMESDPRSFDSRPEIEPVPGPMDTTEQTHRDLGRTALDGAGVAEPAYLDASAEQTHHDLGSTALKSY